MIYPLNGQFLQFKPTYVPHVRVKTGECGYTGTISTSRSSLCLQDLLHTYPFLSFLLVLTQCPLVFLPFSTCSIVTTVLESGTGWHFFFIDKIIMNTQTTIRSGRVGLTQQLKLLSDVSWNSRWKVAQSFIGPVWTPMIIVLLVAFSLLFYEGNMDCQILPQLDVFKMDSN